MNILSNQIYYFSKVTFNDALKMNNVKILIYIKVCWLSGKYRVYK